jgi:tricorn protease-like protein
VGSRLYVGKPSGTTVRVSIGLDGRGANGGSFEADVSADGRAIGFTSHATNLVLGDGNGKSDVFVHDERTGTTERVSVSSTGRQANGASSNAHLSADGRFVAFYSKASNLVPNDANRRGDVFVHDRKTGRTERVGVGSTSPYISGNGRIVVFSSRSTNVVPGDTNGQEDVFVRDRWNNLTKRVTVASNGAQANAASHPSGISGDGRYVAFRSWATNLVPGDTNGKTDAFVHDRRTGRTERLSE